MFIICSCYWYGMTMNWNLAVERNSVLAMLVAMVGITDQPGAARPTTLPGHLHRFVLGLLRPAESATRRLIIVAARGLMVRLPKPRAETGEQRPPSSGQRDKSTPPTRVPFFPMFDPMKRFDRKPARRRIPEDRMPRIALLNDDGWSVPLHLRRPASPPNTRPPRRSGRNIRLVRSCWSKAPAEIPAASLARRCNDATTISCDFDK